VASGEEGDDRPSEQVRLADDQLPQLRLQGGGEVTDPSRIDARLLRDHEAPSPSEEKY
jgi:hypothetical protein